GRRAGTDRIGRIGEVAVVEHPRRRPVEDGDVDLAVGVEVRDLDPGNRSVVATHHEREVEDANDALVDEVDQDRKSFSGHLAAREFDDQVADRPERLFICHEALLSRWDGWYWRGRWARHALLVQVQSLKPSMTPS